MGILLLIACLNAGSVLISRADTKPRSSIALGVGRGRLFRQHLLESLLLAVIACAIGLVLAHYGVHLARTLRPSDLNSIDRMALDRPMAFFAVA